MAIKCQMCVVSCTSLSLDTQHNLWSSEAQCGDLRRKQQKSTIITRSSVPYNSKCEKKEKKPHPVKHLE